ncbi:hypothetical protein J2755_000289 [Methanohalophilus levihalophilus]|uniref:hypothetical protein n=1 Tax=Methanohalophilus levihalophilus TaxID=1431282 RepID=UPI001AE4BE3E|nr:hypothetical protein [Methanohalophilus levihalophilus]MBP2029369.1 hypothetical protein [Methanohalophilus levihalophilus]
MNPEISTGPETPPAAYTGNIAELIGTPGDVEYAAQNTFFPFLGKIMQLSNLGENEILDILDDYEIACIEAINHKKRYEIDADYSRAKIIQVRSHLSAALSLSKGGFAVKQLTSVHKHISYEDGQKNGKLGLMGGILNRGPNNG